jgi:hypothetical protein
MGDTGEVDPDDVPDPDDPEPASSRSQGKRPIPGFHIPWKHCISER